MAQQTAVDYLFAQLWETPKNRFEWYAILSKAKEMEKEQIKYAYKAHHDIGHIYDAEEYYNETYKL